MSIKIPVSAELNQQQITGQIEQVRDALNNLGRDAQGAGKIRFDPINQVSLDNVKKMRAEFEAIVRMSPGLKKALDAGGQGGKSFDQVQWGKVWKDDKQRREHAASLLRRLAPDTFTTVDQPNVPRPNNRPDRNPGPTPGTGSWGRAGLGAAAGIAGGVASQIGGIGGGAASGALAGGLAGGPIGAAVGGLAGAITSLLGAIGEARDIAIGLDTLKRTLGDTNVSFKELQDSTRSLADEYSLTDSEASALTKRYANLSAAGKDTGALRDEVGVGVGFSRSFGMDPSTGVNFFGQMKGLGITKGADDNKRLALMIGESVAKAGELPRMADVMTGLSRYIEATSTRALSGGNSEAWLSKFAGLSQSGLPGTTPGNNSNMIAKADSAVSQGGITEAGRNFMNSALQGQLGLNTIQSEIQLEGGLFATGKGTFGPGSSIGTYNAKNGIKAPTAATSSKTNMEILLGVLEKQYEGRPELMLNAMKTQFGLSYAQAAAFQSTGSVKIGGLVGRLGRLGVDPSKVNPTGISQLSQIEANSALSEGQKDVMAKDAANKNQDDTDGSLARTASINGANAMIRIAEEGLPMLSSIQSGVLKLAGLDPQNPQKNGLKSAHDKRMDDIDNGPLAIERGKAVKNYKDTVPLWKQISGVGLNDEEQQAKDWLDSANGDLSTARKAEDDRYNDDQDMMNTTPSPGISSGGGKPTQELLARAAESDRKAGLPPGTTVALMMQESSFNPGAVSSAGARGMHQIMPSNIARLSQQAGRKLDPTNTDDSFYMYDELMAERKRKYGKDTDKMLRSYHGGYKEERWGAINKDYIPAIERRKREIEAGRRDEPLRVEVHNSGEFTLRDQSGSQVSEASVQTTVTPPKVSGVGR